MQITASASSKMRIRIWKICIQADTDTNSTMNFEKVADTIIDYEAHTLQSDWCVCVEYVSDTNTCKTLVCHVSDSPKLCRILKNYKLVCRHRVQCRVSFGKIQRSCVGYLKVICCLNKIWKRTSLQHKKMLC